jgi:O-antigen/teichoic acid export membrane protein
LIAGLGISTYGIREGAKCREDSARFGQFSNELFSINVLSTIIAYILLLLSLIFIPIFKDYKYIMMLRSIVIIFNLISMDWVNSVYEDYLYITIRGIIAQIVSFVMLFLLVHNENDYYMYVFISVFSSGATSIANVLYVRKKYCKFRICKNIQLRKHVVPILTIFSSGIASTLYNSLDSAMLGIMKGDYCTGIYSVAGRIYSVIKQLMFAILIVSLPRFSAIYEQNVERYKELVNRLFEIVLMVTFPSMVGLWILSKNIILVLSGEKYIESVGVLKILSISLVFSVLAFFVMEIICLPMNNEKDMLWSTIYGAITDFSINFVLIPKYGVSGAAVGTLVAEVVVTCYLHLKNKNLIRYKNKNILSEFIASIVMGVIVYQVNLKTENIICGLLLSVVIGIVVYVLILALLGNSIVFEIKSLVIKIKFEKDN